MLYSEVLERFPGGAGIFKKHTPRCHSRGGRQPLRQTLLFPLRSRGRDLSCLRRSRLGRHKMGPERGSWIVCESRQNQSARAGEGGRTGGWKAPKNQAEGMEFTSVYRTVAGGACSRGLSKGRRSTNAST